MESTRQYGRPATDATALRRTGRALTIGIVINVLYAGIEFGIGFWQGSMGLVADAGHNMSDVVGLLLALIAMRIVRKRAGRRYTYGYKKVTVMISLVNALLLLGAVAGIVVESIRKFIRPEEIEGWSVAATAAVGVVVNFVSAHLLDTDKGRDINIKGAYLHMMLDAMVSIGVVVSGIVIWLTDCYVIDPIIGLVVAAAILFSSWQLLRSSWRLAIDGIPDGIDLDEVIRTIRNTHGVSDVHHLHVWAVSTTETALTAHIVIADPLHADEIRSAAQIGLAALGIAHTTLQTESRHCGDPSREGCRPPAARREKEKPALRD